MSRRRKKGDGNYEVGYGRPPEGTRFLPGKSGNPRGRPKGKKTIGQILQEKLARPVEVTENGTTRKRPMLDVIVSGLINNAARRHAPAQKLLIALLDRYGVSNEVGDPATELLPDDQEILNDYIKRRLEEEGHNEPETSTTSDAGPNGDGYAGGDSQT